MATASKDFKVKNGLQVTGGGSFGSPVTVATPTENLHAATKQYVDQNAGSGSSGATVSDTAPSPAAEGDLWYNSFVGKTYIRYDNFWVEASVSEKGSTGDTGPTGLTGPSGVVAVAAPITNSGTSTSANIGIDLSNIAPIANPTFTGTVSGITATMVNLGNVDNTSDSNKPVSSATQTALNLKANLESPNFTGLIAANPATPAVENTAKAVGYVGMPQVLLTSGNLTLSAANAGDHIYVTGTGQTITIPDNATVPLEIGTTIVIINAAAVTTSIAITTDTLLLAAVGTTGTRTLGAHGMATCVKITSTSWIISGNGLT